MEVLSKIRIQEWRCSPVREDRELKATMRLDDGPEGPQHLSARWPEVSRPLAPILLRKP